MSGLKTIEPVNQHRYNFPISSLNLKSLHRLNFRKTYFTQIAQECCQKTWNWLCLKFCETSTSGYLQNVWGDVPARVGWGWHEGSKVYGFFLIPFSVVLDLNSDTHLILSGRRPPNRQIETTVGLSG